MCFLLSVDHAHNLQSWKIVAPFPHSDIAKKLHQGVTAHNHTKIFQERGTSSLPLSDIAKKHNKWGPAPPSKLHWVEGIKSRDQDICYYCIDGEKDRKMFYFILS